MAHRAVAQSTHATKTAQKLWGKLWPVDAGIQLACSERHPRLVTKLISTLALIAILGAVTACTQKQETPDDIRQKTAQATAELKENTKAVVDGVKEGLQRSNTVDLNKASKQDLMTLPGITSHRADQVIAARPYSDAHQLVSRRILSQTEYDRIKGSVTATP
jgi:hypothetical protein